MKKRVLMGLAPLLGIAAFAVAPAVAQAEPHWYAEGTRIAEAEKVAVTVSGAFNLKITEAGRAAYKVTCKVTGKDTIVNPTGGGAGTDEMTEFTLSACSTPKVGSPCIGAAKIELKATKLPWATKLVSVTKSYIADEWTGVTVEEKCGAGTAFHTFSGTLKPRVTASKTGSDVFAIGKGNELTEGTNKAAASGAQNITGPAGKAKIAVHNP